MKRKAKRGRAVMAVLALTLGGPASAPLWAATRSKAPLTPSIAEANLPAKFARPFVAADFNVPVLVKSKDFKIVPLGPDLAKVDYRAYMSSIAHLQATFTRSTAWPHPGISDAEAMEDMRTEQARFAKRRSFAYAVLTPDGTRELGCIYVYPSGVEGYDAMVRLWVTKERFDAGFDARLYRWTVDWMKKDWPFAKVAYPGRSIDWATWDTLVAANKAKTAKSKKRDY